MIGITIASLRRPAFHRSTAMLAISKKPLAKDPALSPRARALRPPDHAPTRPRRASAIRSVILLHTACPACSVQQSGHAGGSDDAVLTGTPAGAGLGRMAGRTVPARRDRPAAGLHRQP